MPPTTRLAGSSCSKRLDPCRAARSGGAERVGDSGHVTATDLQVDFLEADALSNVHVLRHDVRTDTFPEQSFDLVHTRAVLMHIPDDSDLLPRMVSWLRPGGWLLLEEPDFGMWVGDADPLWRTHPDSWHRTSRAVPCPEVANCSTKSRPSASPTSAPTQSWTSSTEPDFRGCGFVHIGVWGRRPTTKEDLDADHDRE
jgi:SAM-dependent methyltransferase